MKFPYLAGIVLLCLTLAGCDTYEHRAKEKAATFAALSPAQREQLKHGAIQLGDTPDMVYIALGEPDEKRSTTTAKGPKEVWIYNAYHDELSGEIHTGYRRELVYDRARRQFVVFYVPFTVEPIETVAEEYIRVAFRGGKVTEIEQPKT